MRLVGRARSPKNAPSGYVKKNIVGIRASACVYVACYGTTTPATSPSVTHPNTASG